MRIAHLIPTYWPEVTRGSERFVHDLATAQAAAGDEVTILTGHLGPRRVDVEDGVEVIRRRRVGELAPLRHYELHVDRDPGACCASSRAARFDLVHAHFPADAARGVARARARGAPYVFTVHGLPDRRYLVSRRYRLELFERAVAGGRRVHALERGGGAAVSPLHAPRAGRDPARRRDRRLRDRAPSAARRRR